MKEKMNEENKIKNPKDELEISRVEFTNSYRRDNTMFLIIRIVFLALMGVSLWLLFSYPDYLLYIFLGIIVVFVGTFVYTKMTKKSYSERIKKYVAYYRKAVNDYLYDEKGIENIEQEPFEKISKEDMEALEIFSQIESVESNDLVKGKIQNHDFQSINAVVYENPKSIHFFGKVFFIDCETDFQEETIVYLKNATGKGPKTKDTLKEFPHVLSENFLLYSSSEEGIEWVKSVAKYLEKFEKNEYFEDMVIVAKDHRMTFLFSYQENLINIMIKDVVDGEAFSLMKTHIQWMTKILEQIK